MLKSIQWDVYTYLIIALIPFLLLSAWGLKTWDDNRLHRVQCELALDWLEQSTIIAPDFARAGTAGQTMFWQASFEEINSPSAAGQLRWGIIQSAEYSREYTPNKPLNVPGVLNPPDGLFSRDINDGRKNLIRHCPETEPLLPAAFPMVFRDEDSQ